MNLKIKNATVKEFISEDLKTSKQPLFFHWLLGYRLHQN